MQPSVHPKFQDLSDPVEMNKKLFEDRLLTPQPTTTSTNHPINKELNIINPQDLKEIDLNLKMEQSPQSFSHIGRSNITSNIGTHYPGDLGHQAPNVGIPNTLIPYRHFPGLGGRKAIEQKFELSQHPYATSMAQQQQQSSNVNQQQLGRQYTKFVPPPPLPLPPPSHPIQQQQVQIYGKIQSQGKEKYSLLEINENYMFRNPQVYGMNQQGNILNNTRSVMNFLDQ